MLKKSIGLLACLAAFSSCNRAVHMGMLPPGVGCLAVLPFEIQASTKSQQELLSEFIELDLHKLGFSQVLGSREMQYAFDQGNMVLPTHFNTESISIIGNLVGVDYVLFGYISDIPLLRDRSLNIGESQVSVNAFLLNINTSEINWTYSVNKIVEARENTTKWGEISEDIVHALLSNREVKKNGVQPCWKKPAEYEAFAKVKKKIEEKKVASIPKVSQDWLDRLRSKGFEMKYDAFVERSDRLEKLAIERLHEVFEAHTYAKGTEVLVVASHVDAGKNEAEDLKTSQGRGEAVKKYLVKLGANSNRIQVISHGSSQPRVPNLTKKSREMNRRIIIQLQPKKNDSDPR